MRQLDSKGTSRTAARLRWIAWVLLAGAALASPAAAVTDRIEPGMIQLSGWGGYAWGGKIDFDNGQVSLDSAPSYGAQVGLRVQDDGFAFISFTQQSTTARIAYDDATPNESYGVKVGYLQIGGELDLPMSRHLVPFIGLSIGASYVKPEVSNTNANWFFAGSALAGIKIPITKNIGIRTQMRFLGTVVSSDTSFYCASGGGGGSCAIRVDDSTGFIQGDITGGLFVAF
jgi:hypothetical protein